MAEFLITAFNIFILAFAVGYFGSEMIGHVFVRRQAEINESIHLAIEKKENAADLKALYMNKVHNFQKEKEALLERTTQRAKVLEAELFAQVNAEAQRIILRAQKEAELKKIKLKDEIKRDMIIFAAAAAAKIIAENMTDDIQAKLIEQTLYEMGETTWQS